MRSRDKVSFARVGVVLLGFFVMGVGSLPLTAQAQGPVSQKVLLDNTFANIRELERASVVALW